MLKPLTEVQHQQRHLDQIDKRNPLRDLAKQCLHNLAPQCPTTASVATVMEQIHNSTATSIPDFLCLVIENLGHRTQEEEVEKKKMHLKDGSLQFSEEITHLRKKNQALRKQIFEKERYIKQLLEQTVKDTTAKFESKLYDIIYICSIKIDREVFTDVLTDK